MNSLSLVSRHTPVAIKLHAASSLDSSGFRVLCATDLWARSDRALQKALWLAEVTQAQLLMLHVVDGELPLRIAGRRADLARSALEWRLRDVPAARLRPEVSVRVGNPRQTIIRVARDWRADLVVLGALHPRIADRWFGTTAERAASRPSAVLVVNRGEPGPYANAGVIARSCCEASALEDALDRFQILKAGAPVQKTYPRAPRTAEALLTAAPGVIAVEVDRWPGVSGVLRRGVSGMLARSDASDVLITPGEHRFYDRRVRCKHHLRVVAHSAS